MSDSDKAKRLEDAIRYGFIQRHMGKDGKYVFTLTKSGAARWIMEKMGGKVDINI